MLKILDNCSIQGKLPRAHLLKSLDQCKNETKGNRTKKIIANKSEGSRSKQMNAQQNALNKEYKHMANHDLFLCEV